MELWIRQFPGFSSRPGTASGSAHRESVMQRLEVSANSLISFRRVYAIYQFNYNRLGWGGSCR